MSESNAVEPTMEEILASIRRIISEDEDPAKAGAALPIPEDKSAPAAAAPAPAPQPEAEADDDVLELTERAHEPGEAVARVGDLDVYPAEPLSPMPDGEPLVSAPVAAEAGAVFGNLAHRVALPKEGRTLEDLVREMLNPLLKAWLDQHLPAIVQTKVEEEVERIARRHGG